MPAGKFGKTYTPLKAAQSARAAHPSAHAGCFNFHAMGWAHSPRAAHPFAHAVALIFGLWAGPVARFLKQMYATFFYFFYFFFFFLFSF
jgi:hypothetical protein